MEMLQFATKEVKEQQQKRAQSSQLISRNKNNNNIFKCLYKQYTRRYIA